MMIKKISLSVVTLLLCVLVATPVFAVNLTIEETSASNEETTTVEEATAAQNDKEMFDQVMQNYDLKKTANGVIGTLLAGLYGAYRVFRRISGIIIALSWISGISILLIAKKNKPLQKMAFYKLLIGIPILVVVIVFGVGILNSYFIG